MVEVRKVGRLFVVQVWVAELVQVAELVGLPLSCRFLLLLEVRLLVVERETIFDFGFVREAFAHVQIGIQPLPAVSVLNLDDVVGHVDSDRGRVVGHDSAAP